MTKLLKLKDDNYAPYTIWSTDKQGNMINFEAMLEDERAYGALLVAESQFTMFLVTRDIVSERYLNDDSWHVIRRMMVN